MSDFFDKGWMALDKEEIKKLHREIETRVESFNNWYLSYFKKNITFYKDCVLILTKKRAKPIPSRSFFLHGESFSTALFESGKIDIIDTIREANARFPLSLSVDNVVDYIKFFFDAFYCNSEAALIEKESDIPYEIFDLDAGKSDFGNYLSPLRVLNSDESKYTIEGNLLVYEEACLKKIQFNVEQEDGGIDLLSSKDIIDNLVLNRSSTSRIIPR